MLVNRPTRFMKLFNLTTEIIERFKYVQDGLACSKIKINDEFLVVKNQLCFFDNFQQPPEGPDTTCTTPDNNACVNSFFLFVFKKSTRPALEKIKFILRT